MLIIGLGNPILRDDGVGIRVVREVMERLKAAGADEGVSFEEASMGGMALVELMMGHERVVVVDAILTGKDPVGTIRRMVPEDFTDTAHASTPHDMGFLQAIEVGERTFPEELPTSIVIISIEVEDITTFSEELTQQVERAVPEAVEMVINEVRPIREGRT